jgi:subtilase family serine protease
MGRLALRLLVVCILLFVVGPAAAATNATAVAHARVTGRLPANRLLHVTITLRARDSGALASYARAVATPGSSVYHQYLNPSQFGRRFGASVRTVAVVRRALRSRGLPAGRLSRGRLSLSLSARAGSLERALRLSLLELRLPGRRAAVAASASPELKGVGGQVQAIEGLGSLAAPQPLLVRGPRARHTGQPARPAVATGGPQPCAAARNAAASAGAYTSDQIAAAYGFPGLFTAGDLGSGVTVAVYELEPVDPSDLAAYQSCYHTDAAISYVPVDGGAGSGAGSGEAALDVENLLSYAPGARILVYEGPNSSSGMPGAGPYDTFSAIINQDRAQVVSISWGECEQALGSADAGAENTLFAQAAVQGQTIVSAAGDSGSEDCFGSGTIPQPQLAVDDPASQPFVMGVGGSRLSSIGPRPTESVWNDGGTTTGLLQPGAGGGGVSALWTMPPAQRDAAGSLGVLGPGASGSPCGNPGGYCRQVPDVAASADPTAGYEIYWNGSGQAPGEPSGWQTIGGTSAAAPVWAAIMALTDASHSCRSAPVGYVLPALYRAGGNVYGADFNDVRSGNNDFTGTNSGRFSARAGYDEASGLGSPNASSLAASLCALGLRLKAIAAQHSARQASVRLRLGYADAPGARPSLHFFGLPSGLRFDSTRRSVTGRPRRTGLFHVTVIARDAQGALAHQLFTWRVGGAASLRAPTVTGLGGPRPVVTFTLSAGRNAPALRRLVVTVPAALQLHSTRGISVTSGHRNVRVRTSLARGRLQIRPSRAYNHIRIRLATPGLSSASGRAGKSRLAMLLEVLAYDTGGGTSALRSRVRRA